MTVQNNLPVRPLSEALFVKVSLKVCLDIADKACRSATEAGPVSFIPGSIAMKNLSRRRQELLRELARINRQILETQKSIVEIESKIGRLRGQPQTKAA